MQLNFRQKVLGAKCGRSLFYLSCSGKLLTDELVANLNKIISWTSTDMAVENSSGNEPDTSVPVIISTDMLEKDKNRLHIEANKQVERNKVKKVKQKIKLKTKPPIKGIKKGKVMNVEFLSIHVQQI